MLPFEIICGDSFVELQKFDDFEFDACSFSPPYGKGELFDPRKSFKPEGNFLEYLNEIGRVCKITAVNFTQLSDNKRQLPFIEELIFYADKLLHMQLFDRWIIEKPSFKPRRGSRPLNNYEFVLLFLGESLTVDDIIYNNRVHEYKTLFKVKSHGSYSKRKNLGKVGITPYFSEIPNQVFSLYGQKRVLDPFCGSGTSLVEATKLGLDSVGIEISREICKVAMRNCIKTYVDVKKG